VSDSTKETRGSQKKDGKGPDCFPWVIASILLLLGAVLTYEVLAGAMDWIYFGGPLGILALALLWGGWKKGIGVVLGLSVGCLLVWLVLYVLEDPRYRAGLAAFEGGDYSASIEQLDLVIGDDPEHAEAFLARSRAGWKLGHLEQALSDCNKVISLRYVYKEEPYALRGRIHRDLGKNKKAINDFTVSLKYDANPYVVFDRGRVHNRMKSFKKALGDFRIVLRLDAGFQSAWIGMGNAFYGLEEYTRALSAYEEYGKQGGRPTEELVSRIETLRKRIGAR
jgi:tetratricopeptide (TPR) repeat protein